MSRRWSSEPVFTVLLVCTGNICRSALAERLGRAYLQEALSDRARKVRLVSAGVGAVVGSPMHPDTALVLRGLGGEPGDFRARQLVDRIAAEADLTLTMTRAHRQEVLKLAPRALARTFTLREAARLLELVRGVDDLTGDNPAERVRDLVREMNAARARRQDLTADDDIRDPIGQPVEVQQQVGEEVAAALLPVLARIVAVLERQSHD